MKLIEFQESVWKLPKLADLEAFGRSSSHRSILEPLLSRLGVQPLQVDDVSKVLGVTNGRVFAVRWDLTTEKVGFKQPVMSSLLLFHLWRRRTLVDPNSVLIDGGIVNTALALAWLAARLEMQAETVITRHFPDDIRDYVLNHAHGRLRLLQAPALCLGREREFYSYLVKLMRNQTRRQTHLCLWHAKYSGLAMRWMGEAFAESWGEKPDEIVLGIGSGSCLSGYAIPLKLRFGSKTRIIVAEHAQSRLLHDKPLIADLPRNSAQVARSIGFRKPSNSLPHMVLGTHYDEINPLLPQADSAQIDGIACYSDTAWQEISQQCREAGMLIGNSSAANLAVSKHLAQQGRTVFTFIYEPLRSFYIQEPSVNDTHLGNVKSGRVFCADRPKLNGSKASFER